MNNLYQNNSSQLPRIIACSICRKFGHNRRTCYTSLPSTNLHLIKKKTFVKKINVVMSPYQDLHTNCNI